jgi:hypothetical protein
MGGWLDGHSDVRTMSSDDVIADEDVASINSM